MIIYLHPAYPLRLAYVSIGVHGTMHTHTHNFHGITMLWLLLVLASAAAIILWKISSKKHPAAHLSPSEVPIRPIALKGTVTTDALLRSKSEPGAELPIDKDAWEDWSDELYADASRELPAELTITYCDRNGQITRRDITVEKYARTADGGVLAAFCHLRQARRPFIFSRIQFAADRSDGTAIKDLGAWLDERYEASPKGARDRFINNHEAALGALFFVAKADDAFHSKEKSVMRSFCASQGLDDATVQDLVIESIARWAVPSRIAYGKDLRALLERDEPYRRTVLEYAQAIVGTGKTVRDEEDRALERMQREMKLSAQSTP